MILEPERERERGRIGSKEPFLKDTKWRVLGEGRERERERERRKEELEKEKKRERRERERKKEKREEECRGGREEFEMVSSRVH